MERLQCALDFGADAVYLAGKMFGMRTSPGNFDSGELETAVKMSHEKGVKVYLTCNTVSTNEEIDLLPDFLKTAENIGVDALIISDVGALSLAKKYAPGTHIHISTQAGIMNYQTAKTLYEMGASRVVLAREMSLTDIRTLREKTPPELEIECFVHGAMCVSFSGRCLLSNYLVGRDSNRGDCAQPCRWKYHLMEETRPGTYFPVDQDENGTFILNARDMCMIEHIPELVDAGVTSFKIEGRAKSAYYTAVVTNAYRAAVDEYLKCEDKSNFVISSWIRDEMRKVSYREYCTGFYFSSPLDDAQVCYEGGYRREWDVVAVAERCENGRLFAVQRNRFFEGDELEVLQPGKIPFKVKAVDLKNEDGENVPAANKAMMKLSFATSEQIAPGAILRKERDEPQRVIV
ncbi:MAG: U32 family peptidase C-terminal domain-containing protein [Clostridia bacterium]|nr:U32 family peptidase C-terminal domain-containing protein [Clostridia bacterium]